MASQSDLDRTEAFLTAFNVIESALKERTGVSEFDDFVQAARQYRDLHPGWQDSSAVLAFADLRNVIVHRRFKKFQYISVPSEETVSEIEQIRDRLLKPRIARDEFRRPNIATLQASDPMTSLLELVKTRSFTYFPVYDQGDFSGLATSNGITRWLAVTVTGDSLVEFGDHTVGEVLSLEEERTNVEFVPADMVVDDVVYKFQSNVQLEAALVTHNGRRRESLLGIATRWDIADLLPK